MTVPRASEFRRHRRRFPRGAAVLAWCLFLVVAQNVRAAAPYLTGTIADGDSQQIVMPRLPGTWMRSIAWMAPEGETVDEGSIVVRLDPGDLLSTEEAARIALEERRLQTRLSDVRQELAILDAKSAVFNAESAVRVAQIDAGVPKNIQTGLTYEQSQLALLNAQNALQRARDAYESELEKRRKQTPVNKKSIEQAELDWRRAKDALDSTEIRAEQSGLMIYGENERTGAKLFPGESCAAGTLVATIARREALHFRFWVHEADIQKIRKGTVLAVAADALAGRSVRAQVDWLSRQATQRRNWGTAGHFVVTAVPLERLPDAFLPGMSIMAEVEAP